MHYTHFWGLYFNPRYQWRCIQQQHHSLLQSLSHIGIFALIAPLCLALSFWFFGIEWAEKTQFIQPLQIITISGSLYISIIAAVLLLACFAQAMSRDYGNPVSLSVALDLSSFAVTPLLCTGFAWLFPELWFLLLVSGFGLIYTIYLLYLGTSILLNITEERGLSFTSTLVTAGLVLFALLIFCNGLVWYWVMRSQF